MSLVPEMETELMQNYSESYEEFYAMDYTCDIKTCVQEVNWGPCGTKCRNCEAAVQVKVANPQEHFTFRKAVVVVVALEKMKGGGFGPSLFSDGGFGPSLFSDSDLFEIFTNILVEDHIPFHTFERTAMAESVYRHLSSSIHQITDTDHKCLLLNESSGRAQLVALHLQGANSEHKVTLKMASYRPPLRDSMKRPVTLAIEGRSFYLSCLMVNGQPQLQLEVINDSLLSTIRSELVRFLFFKVDTNRDKTTFESAACLGWFISTSPHNEVVTVTSAQDQTATRTFRLSPS